MSDTETTTEPVSTALAVIPAASLPTLLKADETDILGRLKAELDGFVRDVSTPKGRAEIKSKAAKIAVAKMDYVRLGSTLKEDHQKAVKMINAEVKIVEERFDQLRADFRAPLTEFEEIERRRVDGHENALTDIAETARFALPEPTVGEIEARLAVLQDVADRDWQEFSTRAGVAYADATDRLHALLGAAQRRADEQAELMRLREEAAEHARQAAVRAQAERDRQIAAEAAEQARLAAERRANEAAAAERQRVEQERLDREREEAARARAAEAEQRRLENEKQAAHQRAADAERAAQRAEDDRKEAAIAAELARMEAIRQAEEDRAAVVAQAAQDIAAALERDRIQAQEAAAADRREAARRAANRDHKAKLNHEAVTGLIEGGLTRDQAVLAITAIARGTVAHVTISY